jgi:hypothetical protein
VATKLPRNWQCHSPLFYVIQYFLWDGIGIERAGCNPRKRIQVAIGALVYSWIVDQRAKEKADRCSCNTSHWCTAERNFLLGIGLYVYKSSASGYCASKSAGNSTDGNVSIYVLKSDLNLRMLSGPNTFTLPPRTLRLVCSLILVHKMSKLAVPGGSKAVDLCRCSERAT